jgi:uroporphyrinogen-III synthase
MKRENNSSKKRPLSGIRVLVGRARHQASALSHKLRKLGADVLEIPFIEIRKPRSFQSLDFCLRNLAEYDWLILTSVNGVEAMWKRMATLHLNRRHLRHLHVAAIGPATKKAIERRGIRIAVVPREYVAESVVRNLRGRVKGKRVLLVRAKVARDVIPRELRKAGALVDVAEAYETVLPQASRRNLQAALESPVLRPRVIAFTSSSTVRNFVALLGESRKAARGPQTIRGQVARACMSLEGILTASIGPVTSSTLRELGLRVDIEAREYNTRGLVDAIARHKAHRTK